MSESKFDIVICGAGSAGIATCASLLRRKPDLNIALIDPCEDHYYQPGWTMVGGGIFKASDTHRRTADLIPDKANWIKDSVSTFQPDDNAITLASGDSLNYDQLLIAPGLKLDWDGVEGLRDALGSGGVTSNYRYDLAPYTWQLAQELKGGNALFTQPPMPIKCAGAPQKALYLSADHWLKAGRLDEINIAFYNSAPVLFGVEAYVPALMEYIEKYGAALHFTQTLTKIDASTKTATFKSAEGDESNAEYDFLHVCPPQCAPDFIRSSALSDDAGWLDVDPATLRHKSYNNIWGAGDVMNTMNAKTMAAARKQAPVVAQNICAALSGADPTAQYNGYGSCPLTVERGKIVLAEFAYGGKLVPSFPSWLNEGTRPSGFAWWLKESILPWIYWNAMLKGREWLAKS